MAKTHRTVEFPDAPAVCALGQGTWFMGESPEAAADEIRALQAGLDMGLTLIDTAEMYADGGAEEVVGKALEGRRSQAFLVSKVLPSNASGKGTARACEASLRRLRTDVIDLYLLHWRGNIPLSETVGALEKLVSDGKIRHWGVSNFDTDDMQELGELASGVRVQTNQVLYNPTRRGIEFDLLPWCRQQGVPIMAYSPIEQGRLSKHPALSTVAARHDADSAQIALAWVMRHPDVIAIPKSSSVTHLQSNRASLDIELSTEDIADLDAAFPPPKRKVQLEML